MGTGANKGIPATRRLLKTRTRGRGLSSTVLPVSKPRIGFSAGRTHPCIGEHRWDYPAGRATPPWRHSQFVATYAFSLRFVKSSRFDGRTYSLHFFGMKSPILYASMELNGITVRPDSQAVLRKGLDGHPIEVPTGNAYINLYHVFERMQKKDRKLRALRLVRRQIDQSRWWIFVVGADSKAPEVELAEDYDPIRGRYKRYAEELASGQTLKFTKRAEAVKARRAWQLYVPKEKRRHLKSTVREIARGQYVVAVMDRQA